MPHYFGILGSGVQAVVKKEDPVRAQDAISINTNSITCPNRGSKELSLFDWITFLSALGPLCRI